MKSGILPLIWVLLVGAVWGITVLQNQRLLRLFVARHPEIASKEIPFAFSHARHPEKALFFLRSRFRDILRMDPDVWRQRQHFLWLCVASLALPPVGFIIMLVYAIISAHTPG